MAAHTCISGVWEAEVGEPQVLGQLGLRGTGMKGLKEKNSNKKQTGKQQSKGW